MVYIDPLAVRILIILRGVWLVGSELPKHWGEPLGFAQAKLQEMQIQYIGNFD